MKRGGSNFHPPSPNGFHNFSNIITIINEISVKITRRGSATSFLVLLFVSLNILCDIYEVGTADFVLLLEFIGSLYTHSLFILLLLNKSNSAGFLESINLKSIHGAYFRCTSYELTNDSLKIYKILIRLFL